MRIEITGPDIWNTSGYSVHTRQLANALYDLHDDVSLNIPKPQNWEMQSTNKEIEMIKKEHIQDCVMIFIGQPQYWQLGLSQKPTKFYGYVVWEGDKIPLYWLTYMLHNRVDGIFVPSNHVKQAIITSINASKTLLEAQGKEIIAKISIIAHGVDLMLYNKQFVYKEKFTFIANKGWLQGENDRGGIQYILKAFTEEFTNKEDVKLLVHVNPSYNHPQWNLQNEYNKLQLKNENLAEIQIENKPMTNQEMATFYNSGDVFVAPTMAEAFNLAGIEAMACGLPVLTTNFGGQTDYVNEMNGWLIGGEMVDVTWDINYEGVKWLKPSMEGLRKKMREIYEQWKSKDVLLLNKGMNAIITAKEYTWINSAKKILEITNLL